MTLESTVDLAFPITPGKVPLDHGYLLYSALAGPVPELHGADWLGIHPLSGQKMGESYLVLTRGSHVTLRMPADRLPLALKLAERNIDIAGGLFQLGRPTLRALEPHSALFARQVAIRLTSVPQLSGGGIDLDAFRTAFEAEARRQMEKLGASGVLRATEKRTLTIKSQHIIAFSLAIDGLSPKDSLTLQFSGLGGKRRMGCGIFRRARADDASS